MYDTILMPTDGSEAAENAIAHALELADRYDAAVHALYVVDTDAVNYGLGTEQLDRIRQGNFDEMDELRDRAETALAVVTDAAADRGIEATDDVGVGRPHTVVADHAADGVDLIVMGSHGRSGVRRALLGSVTERVLRSTDVPVLVVDVGDD
jgi:nucleotide-binding universal stress UspA family protein